MKSFRLRVPPSKPTVILHETSLRSAAGPDAAHRLHQRILGPRPGHGSEPAPGACAGQSHGGSGRSPRGRFCRRRGVCGRSSSRVYPIAASRPASSRGMVRRADARGPASGRRWCSSTAAAGRRYKEWVKRWNEHGFAAISIAVEGQTDERQADGRTWKRHAWAGPARDGIYADSALPAGRPVDVSRRRRRRARAIAPAVVSGSRPAADRPDGHLLGRHRRQHGRPASTRGSPL